VFSLAGIRFSVEPSEALHRAEQQSLAALGPVDVATSAGATRFPVHLLTAPPWTDGEPPDPHLETPAAITWAGDRVRVHHRAFAAEIDAFGAEARLYRTTEHAFPLEITLRTALAARLPLEGGLPLHAAGLVMDGGAVVFFGDSGAGKSTLAGLSPFPVLSDELVAVVRGAPFAATRTGFWGTLGRGNAPAGSFPLRALVGLEKGPFRLERLTAKDALRQLVGRVLVPLGPPLWREALAVIGRLAAAVPVYRMWWTLGETPWKRLRRAL
jgi:hypothetical protein